MRMFGISQSDFLWNFDKVKVNRNLNWKTETDATLMIRLPLQTSNNREN